MSKVANSVSTLRKVPILNAFVHDVSMEDVLNTFNEGLMLTLHTDMLIKLQKDREFYAAMHQFDLVTCDSQIMYWALKFLGTPVAERVSGSDFLPKFYTKHKANPDVRIFLLGGQEGVATEAADRINGRVQREIVVGTDAPPLNFENRPEELERVLDKIRQSEATVLVVGLGGGRQEKFILAVRDKLPKVRMFLPLGGTIDYEAGALSRPAPWVTNAGLEWLYRVFKEPKKRWRRYFVEQPPALWMILKQRLGLYRDPFGDT